MELGVVPARGWQVVVQKTLSDQLMGALRPPQQLHRFLQITRKWLAWILVRIPLASDGRLDFVLDTPEPRREGGAHSNKGIHVRAEHPLLDSGRFLTAGYYPKRGGAILEAPAGGGRSPSVFDASLVAVDRLPEQRRELGHHLERPAA